MLEKSKELNCLALMQSQYTLPDPYRNTIILGGNGKVSECVISSAENEEDFGLYFTRSTWATYKVGTNTDFFMMHAFWSWCIYRDAGANHPVTCCHWDTELCKMALTQGAHLAKGQSFMLTTQRTETAVNTDTFQCHRCVYVFASIWERIISN